MNIAIIGPGALGCLLAASLGKGNQVLILDHNSERAATLDHQGLLLEKAGRKEMIPIRATSDPRDIAGADLVLLCVKSHRVNPALKTAHPFLNKNTLVLALQNGIGHISVIQKLPAEIPRALGVTALGATLVGQGHVIHQGDGLTRIGQLTNTKDKACDLAEKINRVASTLSSANIMTEAVPDILNHVWAKLLVNVGINALTAIHNCPNGALLESSEKLDMMVAAILEGKEVAERSGISLPGDPVKIARQICRATSANISSMLQDVRAKKPTEIDAINGAVINIADQLGVPVPVNRELTAKVKDLESNYHDFT